MRKIYFTILALLTSLSVIGPARATEPATDSFRVVIRPFESIDLESLQLEGLTRAERYALVSQELRDISQRSQAPIIQTLDSMKAAGDLLNYQTHWIDNIISVSIANKDANCISSANFDAYIEELPKIRSIKAQPGNARGATSAPGPTGNLLSIGIRSAWNSGITGSGRIICSFDTGIEGGHPALRRSWNGRNADSSASWFDPVGGLKSPHTFTGTPSPGHGTAVMGIMVGADTTAGDTTGVAPGAKWISAAVIDIAGASIIDAFEWAADPDRDPNTISDVPDVINHSWGVPTALMGCDDLFWRLIDNTEALGIVNIFAAGNEGRQGASTIRNPANRALTNTDCFAVGDVDSRDTTAIAIDPGSSRGPSDCDGISIKPNISAPGVFIRTSVLGGGFDFRSGTSMAAPHISGIVALMRQKNPDASPLQIKQALLAGAQDLGDSGPDNSYGWGFINIGSALNALPTPQESALRVFAMTPSMLNDNNELRATVWIQNNSLDPHHASNVRARVIAPSFSGVTIDQDDLSFGTIPAGEIRESAEELVLHLDQEPPDGAVIALIIDIFTGATSRRDDLFVLVGPHLQRQFYTHTTPRLSFTVSNFGEYGFAAGSYSPLGMAGFKFENEMQSSLFEMAFAVGVDPEHVSDGIRNIGLEPDRDFVPAPGGRMTIDQSPAFSDHSTVSSFADTLAESPLGLQIKQTTYSWLSPQLDNVVVIDYVIQNKSTVTLGGLRAGIFADWDLGVASQNVGSFSLSDNLGYILYDEGDTVQYRGIAVLSELGLKGHYVQDMSEFGVLRNPLTESFKYASLTSGFTKAADFTRGDMAHMVSTGPYSLSPGDSARATFAIVAGHSLDEIVTAANNAKLALDSAIDPFPGPIGLPSQYALTQNYPNPFNPETIIDYSLPNKGFVTLDIYNTLGQRVRTLYSGVRDAGEFTARWSGEDDNGARVASGVYLYRLRAGEISLSRKMLLVR